MFNKIELKDKKIIKLFLIGIIAIIAISMISSVSATDKKITNTTNGGLKKAIETFEPGSTIYLKNGVYKGVNNTRITINKNINIKGLGSKVIIDGQRKNHIFNITGEKVLLKNLKLKNGYSKDYDGAIHHLKGSLTLKNCIFITNKAVKNESNDVQLRNITNESVNLNELLKPYLVASVHCQVDDGTITALATQLTKGPTSEWAKAEAIFNYVRDTISHSFYYNTKNGAKNTLTSKIGNAVDQSHLLISLARASGLAARYVHGEAKFTSGNTYGHVWVQIKIGDTWVVADPISGKNSLGVINNWNINTVKIFNKYATLPF